MATAHADRLERLALFADVPRQEIEAFAGRCEHVSFGEGEWVIRKGDEAEALYVILDGEVGVVFDDVERAVLSTGSFFGEVALLLGEKASGNIVTRSPVECLVIRRAELEGFLLASPRVTLNMLRTEARRVRTATQWH
jgi:CRP-like cAMP-binding protein